MEEYITQEIYRNTQFFVQSNYLVGACPEQEVCPINIFVEMKESNKDIRVELIMHQIDGAPFYLEKRGLLCYKRNVRNFVKYMKTNRVKWRNRWIFIQCSRYVEVLHSFSLECILCQEVWKK